MKNIFILPTESSSIIQIDQDNNLRFDDTRYLKSNIFIYITNEEDIKANNWCYDDKFKNVFKYLGEGALLKITEKVVLTNDPKLITDGVQELTEEQLKEIVSKYPLDYVEVSRIKDVRDDAWYNTALCKTIYSLSFSAENKHKGKELTTEEVMEGRISAYNFLDFNDSPEKETLEKIKFVLSANNESQAIRFIEQYGEWVKENYLKEFKTEIDKIRINNEDTNSWGDGFEYAIQEVNKYLKNK